MLSATAVDVMPAEQAGAALPPCLLQFFGWMVGTNTMLEYVLAASTVAKGFASYFTTLIGMLLPCLPSPGPSHWPFSSTQLVELSSRAYLQVPTCCQDFIKWLCCRSAKSQHGSLHIRAAVCSPTAHDQQVSLCCFLLQANRQAAFSSVWHPAGTLRPPSSSTPLPWVPWSC